LIGPSPFLSSPALSQVTDPAQTQSAPILLPTEVISATRYERPLNELPLSATVITREDILNSPGRTIDDSLRNVAGIQLHLDSADVIFPIIPSIAQHGEFQKERRNTDIPDIAGGLNIDLRDYGQVGLNALFPTGLVRC
jgi:hypothetical protein